MQRVLLYMSRNIIPKPAKCGKLPDQLNNQPTNALFILYHFCLNLQNLKHTHTILLYPWSQLFKSTNPNLKYQIPCSWTSLILPSLSICDLPCCNVVLYTPYRDYKRHETTPSHNFIGWATMTHYKFLRSYASPPRALSSRPASHCCFIDTSPHHYLSTSSTFLCSSSHKRPW